VAHGRHSLRAPQALRGIHRVVNSPVYVLCTGYAARPWGSRSLHDGQRRDDVAQGVQCATDGSRRSRRFNGAVPLGFDGAVFTESSDGGREWFNVPTVKYGTNGEIVTYGAHEAWHVLTGRGIFRTVDGHTWTLLT